MTPKLASTLHRVGALCFAAFPAVLVLAYALHFAGEFGPSDFVVLRLRYVQPPPERFMELFRSGSPLDFAVPHLLIYLALPLAVPGVVATAALLADRMPRLAIAGALLALVGTIYMGGVFGAWLSFRAVGDVAPHEVAGAIPALAALIRDPRMLALTSALAGLSLAGILVLAAGLLWTGAVPRWQAALLLAGNAVILAFMDIDNLMLVGASAWLVAAVAMRKARPAWLVGPAAAAAAT